MPDIENKMEWDLRTADTHITIAIHHNRLAVLQLINPLQDWNWTAQPSEIPLPDRVDIENTAYHPGWIFRNADIDCSCGKKVTFVFVSDSPKMELKSVWWACPGPGPVEHGINLQNLTDSRMTVYYQPSLVLNVKAGTGETLTAWRFHKDSSIDDPVGVYTDLLADGISCRSVADHIPKRSGFIPFMVFQGSKDHGLYIGYEFIQSVISASSTGTDPANVLLMAGMFENFKTDIPVNGFYEVPAAYLGAYQGDPDDAGNRFKQWFVQYKIPQKSRDDPDEPLTGYTPPCGYTDPDFPNARESQVILENFLNNPVYPLASWGVQSITVDYGWWMVSRDPPCQNHEGDWRADPVDWPLTDLENPGNPIRHTTDLAHNKGIKSFTLYFLLHDGKSENHEALSSIGPNGHPEWFGGPGYPTWPDKKYGDIADLGNPDCVAFVKNRLLQCFDHYDLQTYRSDYFPIPVSSPQINNHRYGSLDTAYWASKGFYSILDHLYASKPDFRYECCSAGGAMKDFATLKYCCVIYGTDHYNALTVRKMFFDSSYCVPSRQLTLPMDTNSADLKVTGHLDYNFRTAIMAAVQSGWGGSAEDFPTGLYCQYYNLYNTYIKPLVRDANLYHILPRPDGICWDGMEYYNPANGKGVAFVYKPSQKATASKYIRFKGLDRGRIYRVHFQDGKGADGDFNGALLMDTGVLVKTREEEEYISEIIWLDQ